MSKGNVKAPVKGVSRALSPFNQQESHGKSQANPGLDRRPGGSFKATSTEMGTNSGAHDKNLSSAARSLYAKAIKTTDKDSSGDTAFHKR